MAHVPYFQVGASCLPIIGPFVGLYNALTVEMQRDKIADFKSSLENMQNSNKVFHMRAAEIFASFGRTQETILAGLPPEESSQACATRETINGGEGQIVWKGRLFSICSLLGNLLSIVTIVGLVAFGTIKKRHGVMVAPLYLCGAALHAYHFNALRR